jgi:hypothetical protein
MKNLLKVLEKEKLEKKLKKGKNKWPRKTYAGKALTIFMRPKSVA